MEFFFGKRNKSGENKASRSNKQHRNNNNNSMGNNEIKVNTLYIVRHGERLDEVKHGFTKWDTQCAQYRGNVDLHYSRLNDPPLTETGLEQAAQVAKVLKQKLSSNSIKYIISSKLLRAVQTAQEIAKEFSVPLILTSYFAESASAVESLMNSNMKYHFVSVEEIQALYPDIKVVDGDNVNELIAHEPIFQNVDSTSLMENLLHAFGREIEHSIVVAHRETIRNLGRARLHTPYCCFGEFACQIDQQQNITIQLENLFNRDGEVIMNDR